MAIWRIIIGAALLAALAIAPAQAAKRVTAAIVVDTASGEILYRHNIDRPIYPASLTKMMTIYLALEAVQRGQLHMDQRLPVSRAAAREPRVKLGLKAGSTIRLRHAIMSMIVASSNDSAVVVAEALSRNEAAFANRMTRKARHLGMVNTTFKNANGLPHRQQKSTARDMSILATALIRDFPKYYPWFSARQFTWNGRRLKSTNKLLTAYPGVDGLKTGYINASGYNLAASAVRHGRRLVAIYIGGKTGSRRDASMQKILSTGFSRARSRARQGQLAAISPPPPRPEIKSTRPVQLIASAVAAPPPRPGSVVRNTGDYGVQVGAFSTPTRARRGANNAVSAAPQWLGDRPVAIREMPFKRGKLYRAQLHNLSLVDARETCRALRLKSLDCMVIRAQ